MRKTVGTSVRYSTGAVAWSRLMLAIGVITALCIPTPAHATNGPQVIGFSAASAGLAGAGMVAVDDTSAINTNPAALSLIQGTRLDFTPVILKPNLHHKDVFGNDTDGENNIFVLGNAGFARRLTSIPRLTVGAGIFSQGGFGTDTRNLTTAFGTTDQASSFFRYVKVAAALSYEVTDKLSIGISPHIGYSDVSFRLFPATSTPGFAGIDIRDRCARNGGLGGLGDSCPSDVVFGVKAGAMYKVRPWLTVGASYTSPVTFNHTGGEASLNLSSFGLGRVNYDARITGLKWPQQVDVSMAATPTDRLLIAFTTSWINWASLNGVTLTAENPNNPFAPGKVSVDIPFNWKDQVVVSIGMAYTALQDQDIKDRLVLRVGYNFSNNPVPNETLSPLAPLILTHRIGGGVGYRFTERWSFDTAVLYALNNSVTYTNNSLPFGPNATESAEGYFVYNTLSYRF